jgi:hypothetical protein
MNRIDFFRECFSNLNLPRERISGFHIAESAKELPGIGEMATDG